MAQDINKLQLMLRIHKAVMRYDLSYASTLQDPAMSMVITFVASYPSPFGIALIVMQLNNIDKFKQHAKISFIKS